MIYIKACKLGNSKIHVYLTVIRGRGELEIFTYIRFSYGGELTYDISYPASEKDYRARLIQLMPPSAAAAHSSITPKR